MCLIVIIFLLNLTLGKLSLMVLINYYYNFSQNINIHYVYSLLGIELF